MTHSGSGALTRYKKLSVKAWMQENKAAFFFFTSLLILGMLAGASVPLIALCISRSFAVHLLFNPAFAFAGGFILSFGLLYAARALDRKVFGVVKSGILSVEDRIVSGNSPAQMDDLQKLVDGYLKLKRFEAADFYSKKLLELSKSGGTAVLNLSDWVVTSDCWVSTEKYNKSLKYMVWLFETRGVITLSADRLDFQSKKFHFSCNPSHVISVEKKRHPLWMKPFPLHYIKIVIDECGEKHTFNITPSFGHTDTVFDANRMVDVWFKRLTNFKHTLRPAGSCPDWVQDLQANG